MKKLACFGVLLCLALAVFTAIPFATGAAAEESSAVVYVYDEQGWDLNIYCYAGGGDFGPSWPGVALDRAPTLGENWYSYELPSDPTGKAVNMIIFDSGKDSDRVEVAYNKSNIYYHTYAAKGFATKEAAEADAISKRPSLVDTLYIYNYSIDDEAERWENIYASCYDNKTGEQLGTGVLLGTATSIGEHWYKYDLPTEAKTAAAADYRFRARVVVSNGESGRERLVIVAPVEATKYYNTYRDYGFASSLTAAKDEFNCVYSDPKTGTTRLYYYNSQRWKAVYAYAYWTYAAANNVTVEDFGSWPGKLLKEVEDRENWYYIDLPQDVDKQAVGVVFNSNTKGRTKLDANINNSTKVYVNYDGMAFTSFAACEDASVLLPPLPDVDDYLLDFDNIDTTEKTVTVTEYKTAPNNSRSLTAPIVVLAIAGASCAAVGAVLIILTVRRKKK